MRNGISILLALLFSVGPFAAVFPGAQDANLPACCRRHGAHHCAMAARTAANMVSAERGSVSVSAPSACPYYPGLGFALLTPAAHAVIAVAAEPLTAENHKPRPAATQPAASTSLDWAHGVRGPPFLS